MKQDLSKMEPRECPHCGEKAEFLQGAGGCYYRCFLCSHMSSTQEIALAKWNRRATPPELVETYRTYDDIGSEFRLNELLDVVEKMCEGKT